MKGTSYLVFLVLPSLLMVFSDVWRICCMVDFLVYFISTFSWWRCGSFDCKGQHETSQKSAAKSSWSPTLAGCTTDHKLPLATISNRARAKLDTLKSFLLSVPGSSFLPCLLREHHGACPSLSTTRPIQQYNEDLDNFRNNSKLASAQEHPYALPPDHPDHPDHVNNLLNCCDADTHNLLHSMDSLILTSMAKPEYTKIDMPPVYPYPSTNAILQGGRGSQLIFWFYFVNLWLVWNILVSPDIIILLHGYFNFIEKGVALYLIHYERIQWPFRGRELAVTLTGKCKML